METRSSAFRAQRLPFHLGITRAFTGEEVLDRLLLDPLSLPMGKLVPQSEQNLDRLKWALREVGVFVEIFKDER